MPEPRRREFELELPMGYEDQDGRVHRSAVLRKMTGRDEAVMADKRYRNNGAKMITELLGNCLVRLGDLESPGSHVVQRLFSADRHFLLVRLREITFGPQMRATYSCATCHEATERTEDLAELEVVRLEDGQLPEDMVVELDDGYVDRAGNVYDSMVFRYPVGTDEERIASQAKENASRGKNALLARCLRAMGDMPTPKLEALGSAVFADLTLADRARIDHAMNNGGPGIKLRRTITCDGCGRDYSASLDMSNFLVAS
ncbi:hypothetical protein [Streptomyces sp. NPDC048172]|uniref:T4 family baseplate hub assembly chaperone n=1 Tax=Streptomyces sp. NPDC048172 TaxID=3365505 RepID=UPI00371CEC10